MIWNIDDPDFLTKDRTICVDCKNRKGCKIRKDANKRGRGMITCKQFERKRENRE